MITLLFQQTDLEIQNGFNTLPIMHWLSLPNINIHKAPTGVKFIVASRKYSTKAFSKADTKTFKLTFKQIQSLPEKSHFYSD